MDFDLKPLLIGLLVIGFGAGVLVTSLILLAVL